MQVSQNNPSMERVTRARVTFATLAIAASLVLAQPAAAAPQPTLTDREQIADLIVDYYDGLRTTQHDFSAFFTPDGVVDVDGWAAKGIKEIDALYSKVWKLPELQHQVRHYLVTNEKIVVNADKATAEFLWTIISAQTIDATPKFQEMGTEHDDLVKLNGQWRIKYRHVVGDGGVPTALATPAKK